MQGYLHTCSESDRGAQAGWIFLNNYHEQSRGYEIKYGISNKTNIENEKENAKAQLFESKVPQQK